MIFKSCGYVNLWPWKWSQNSQMSGRITL